MAEELHTVHIQNPVAFIQKVRSLESMAVGAIAVGVLILSIVLGLLLTVVSTKGVASAAYLTAFMGGVGAGFAFCATLFLQQLREPMHENEATPTREDPQQAA